MDLRKLSKIKDAAETEESSKSTYVPLATKGKHPDKLFKLEVPTKQELIDRYSKLAKQIKEKYKRYWEETDPTTPAARQWNYKSAGSHSGEWVFRLEARKEFGNPDKPMYTIHISVTHKEYHLGISKHIKTPHPAEWWEENWNRVLERNVTTIFNFLKRECAELKKHNRI